MRWLQELEAGVPRSEMMGGTESTKQKKAAQQEARRRFGVQAALPH